MSYVQQAIIFDVLHKKPCCIGLGQSGTSENTCSPRLGE
jgi:hypothetical protein